MKSRVIGIYSDAYQSPPSRPDPSLASDQIFFYFRSSVVTRSSYYAADLKWTWYRKDVFLCFFVNYCNIGVNTQRLLQVAQSTLACVGKYLPQFLLEKLENKFKFFQVLCEWHVKVRSCSLYMRLIGGGKCLWSTCKIIVEHKGSLALYFIILGMLK